MLCFCRECWSQEADARGRGEANSRGGWEVLSRKVAFALLLECLDVTWEDGRKTSSGWGHGLSQSAEGGRSWGPRGDVRTSEAERMRMWTECGRGLAHGSKRHRTVALATHFLLTGNFCRESLSFLDLVSSGKPRW